MVIVVGSIARCIIFGVPRLPIRPCDERPPAMYGHFCLVPRVSVHDRYYCMYKIEIKLLSFHQLVTYCEVCHPWQQKRYCIVNKPCVTFYISAKMYQPYFLAYVSSKFALTGFFGGLRLELQMRGSGVSITICFLGFIGV